MARQATAGYEVTNTAQEVVNAWSKKTGVPKKLIVERVMKWFAAQPSPVKRVVLNDVDEELAEAYAELLEEMAAAVRKSSQGGSFSPAVADILDATPDEPTRDRTGAGRRGK